MRILAVISGAYGARHVANLRANAPADWRIDAWRVASALPPVIDTPGDHVPHDLAPADLILAVAEQTGVAELIPVVARVTRARAVIAGIDNEEWLPRGLARQLRGRLAEAGVACATPKPLCSLTETRYSVGQGQWVPHDDPDIATFARHFGRPDLFLTIDPGTRRIVTAEVRRDAVCGCARHVAEGLVGTPVDVAEQKAGVLHAHFPCVAGMDRDCDFGDTLRHVSGKITMDDVGEQVNRFRP